MNTRTFAIVSTAVIGTPLLAAAVLTVCSPTVAVIVCLAVAGAGVVGTVTGLHLIAARGMRSADSGKADVAKRASYSASVDRRELREAISSAIVEFNKPNTP